MTGCRSAKPSAPAPGSGHVQRAHAAFNIALSVAPLPIQSLDLKTLTVHLTDAHGRPVTGAHVTADLNMTTMDMGKNEADLIARGPGLYVGHARFTMMGEWAVTITAAKGSRRAVRSFDFVAQ